MNYLKMNDDVEVIFDEVEDCYMLQHGDGSVPLNDSTVEIINLCDGEHRTEDIINKLQEKYIDADVAEDVEDFVTDAIEQGWISLVDKW